MSKSFAYNHSSIGIGIICLSNPTYYVIFNDCEDNLIELEKQGYLNIQLKDGAILTEKGRVLQNHIIKQLEFVGEPLKEFTPNTLTNEDNHHGE